MDGRYLKHMVSINNPGHNIIIKNIKIEAVKKVSIFKRINLDSFPFITQINIFAVSWEIPFGPKHVLPPTLHLAVEILFEEIKFLSTRSCCYFFICHLLQVAHTHYL